MSKKLKLTKKHKSMLAAQLDDAEMDDFRVGDKVGVYESESMCSRARRWAVDRATPDFTSTIIQISIGLHGIEYKLASRDSVHAENMMLLKSCTPKRLQKLVRNIARNECDGPLKGVCK